MSIPGQKHHTPRALAIDLSSRGFGYALFDSEGKLVDWGVRKVTGNKNAGCLTRIRALIRWYEPEVIVLEDCESGERHQRIKELSEDVSRLAERMEIRVVQIPWILVQSVCGGSPRATKEEIAARIGDHFPEIKPHLPPKRKPWMSEDERMSLFDAVALAATACVVKKRREGRTA